MTSTLSVSPSLLNAFWKERAKRNPDHLYFWAMAHCTVAGRLPIHLPYLEALAEDTHPIIVIQKSAQVGVTEFLLRRALHAADTGFAGRGSALYVMPTQATMEDLVQARLDPVIDASPYLRSRIQQARRGKQADNRRVKRLGRGTVYFRGAESIAGLSSIPIDLAIVDEYDLAADNEGILDLVRQRLTSSKDPRLILASTPRLPESGINALYLHSDQRRYYLPCPHCAKEQPLQWPDNVDRKRKLVVCRFCRTPIDVLAEGRWVAEAPGNSDVHGYHLNRLYSPWLNLPALLEEADSPGTRAQQEFFNSGLGEPFVPRGSGLSIDTLDRCRLDYTVNDYNRNGTKVPCVMGVDVGTKIHVVVRACPPKGKTEGDPQRRLWWAWTVDSFDELDGLMKLFNVRCAVIDAQPEAHKAREFANRAHDRVWLAFYGRQQPGHQFEKNKRPLPNVVHANRSELLEETFARFHARTVGLPKAARALGGYVKNGIGEYYREMTAVTRRFEYNSAGDLVSRWTNNGKDDHFAHAEAYALLAEQRYLTVTGSSIVRLRDPESYDHSGYREPWPTLARWGRE